MKRLHERTKEQIMKRKMNIEPGASSTSSTSTGKSQQIQPEHLLEDQKHSPNETSAKTRRKLGTEVVIVIVNEWLSLSERNSCRLVCRDWYDALRVYENKEKFSIVGNDYREDQFEEVLVTLSKSTRRCFHFDFYEVEHSFENSQSNFWITCGPQIRSLKFVDCRMSVNLFVSILKYCSNLETFMLHSSNQYILGSPSTSMDCRKIIHPNLKNISLRTLTIDSEVHEDYDAIFRAEDLLWLLSAFPNITNFSFHEHSLSGCISHDCRPDRKKLESYLKPYPTFREAEVQQKKLLGFLTRDQIESVAMDILFLYLPYFNCYIADSNIKLTKITEIVVDCHSKALTTELVKLAKELVNLKKVTGFTYARIRKEDIKSFVIDVLKIPSLREFRLLLQSSTIYWCTDWSTSLSTSNVQTLRIHCRDIRIVDIQNSFYQIRKLTSLIIDFEENYTTDSDFVLILKMFPNLQDLHLSNLRFRCAKILESICINQTKLRSLMLPLVWNEDDFELSNLMNRLKKCYFGCLEYCRKLIPRSK